MGTRWSKYFEAGLCIYCEQCEKLLRKKKMYLLHYVSMEMAAILDFMALAKVHITLKPLDHMQ